MRPHRSGGGPGYFRDERLQRIENLMNAKRGTPEGAELDKLVDEQVAAEAQQPSADAPRVLAEQCPKCSNMMCNWSDNLTKCTKCQHEWYMDTSSERTTDSAP